MASTRYSATYTFRPQNGTLRHQPRTLNDLAHKEHFEHAEGSAQALKDEVLDTYHDMMALDGTKVDHNGRPHEVLLENYPHENALISGRAKRQSGQNPTSTEVMNIQKNTDGEKAQLKLTMDLYREEPYLSMSRGESGVRESLVQGSYIREGVTEYSVSADYDAPSPLKNLAYPPYAKDHLPTLGARRQELSGKVNRDPETGELRYEPRTLGDLGDSERRKEIAAIGNHAQDTLKAVVEGFRDLDDSESDLNRKPGEILLKDQLVAGRTLSGYLSEQQVRKGNTTERELDGMSPYLQAVAEDAEGQEFTETFQAFLGENPTYHYDDGEKLIEVVSQGWGADVKVSSPKGPTRKELDQKKREWNAEVKPLGFFARLSKRLFG